VATGSADRVASGHKRLGGGELVALLNQTVATLIAENRRLLREIEKLRARPKTKARSSSRRRAQPVARPKKSAARPKKIAARPKTKPRPKTAAPKRRKPAAQSRLSGRAPTKKKKR